MNVADETFVGVFQIWFWNEFVQKSSYGIQWYPIDKYEESERWTRGISVLKWV